MPQPNVVNSPPRAPASQNRPPPPCGRDEVETSASPTTATMTANRALAKSDRPASGRARGSCGSPGRSSRSREKSPISSIATHTTPSGTSEPDVQTKNCTTNIASSRPSNAGAGAKTRRPIHTTDNATNRIDAKSQSVRVSGPHPNASTTTGDATAHGHSKTNESIQTRHPIGLRLPPTTAASKAVATSRNASRERCRGNASSVANAKPTRIPIPSAGNRPKLLQRKNRTAVPTATSRLPAAGVFLSPVTHASPAPRTPTAIRSQRVVTGSKSGESETRASVAIRHIHQAAIGPFRVPTRNASHATSDPIAATTDSRINIKPEAPPIA